MGTARSPSSRSCVQRGCPKTLGTTEFASPFSRRENPKPRFRLEQEETIPGILLQDAQGTQLDPPVSSTPPTPPAHPQEHQTRHKPEETPLVHPPSENSGIKKSHEKKRRKELPTLVPWFRWCHSCSKGWGRDFLLWSSRGGAAPWEDPGVFLTIPRGCHSSAPNLPGMPGSFRSEAAPPSHPSPSHPG